MKTTSKFIAKSGIIAAMYVLLTFVSSIFGLASGQIQVRISEALCVLPIFTPTAVPGLFVGCLLSNLLFGGGIIDVIFGSLATLIGAFATRMLRKSRPLAVAMPILANTIILPLVEVYAFGITAGYLYIVLTIFIGELISIGVLGAILIKVLSRHSIGGEIF